MTLLRPLELAQIHRETYVAIIDSTLTMAGDAQALADRIPTSPAYLSQFQHLDDGPADSYRNSKQRVPGKDIAPLLAAALPVSQEVREALLWHIERDREARREAERTARSERG